MRHILNCTSCGNLLTDASESEIETNKMFSLIKNKCFRKYNIKCIKQFWLMKYTIRISKKRPREATLTHIFVTFGGQIVLFQFSFQLFITHDIKTLFG